jgi:cytoskeletal protein RodZ
MSTSNNNTLIIVIVIIIVVIIIYYFIKKSNENKEKFSIQDPEGSDIEHYTEQPKHQSGKKQMSELSLSPQSESHQSHKKKKEIEFTHKKKKYILKTANDIKDQFDVEKLKPKEINKSWFDVEPLMTNKKKNDDDICFTHGINTIQGSRKNACRDPRGNVSCPKIDNISPWLNSAFEPDVNLRNVYM